MPRITQIGWQLESFFHSRGCCQGDPISPYIFIICTGLMSQAIRNCEEMRCPQLNRITSKLTQFADDTSLFQDGTNTSLIKTIELLNFF